VGGGDARGSGQKALVPFDNLIVFATNLDPASLVDEAFLRRIRYKIEIGDPSPEAYRRIADDQAALGALERCVSLQPRDADLLLDLGQAYLRAGRASDAREVLERGIGYQPGYGDYYLVLGIVEYSEGDVDRARERFERFLALAPERRAEVEVWLARTESR